LKKFIYIVIICAIVVGGIVLIKKSKKPIVAAPTSHIYGTSSTGVTLVEYGDFQCPGCGGFFPLVKQLKDKYKDLISFQFVNFPLTQLHQNAQAAHRAAQAASNQGKFWEMHDLLYTNQNTWKDSTNAPKDFEAYAQQLKLDLARFRVDFASAQTNAIIAADIATGQAKKITGTPTFFLDGKQITENASISTLDKFSKTIDDEIQVKTGKPSPVANLKTIEANPDGTTQVTPSLTPATPAAP
jgi:protein-disulfide isomerase